MQLKRRKLDDYVTYERAHELLRYVRSTGALYWRANGRRADKGGDRRYMRVTIDGHRHQAHRVIWLMETGDWPAKGEIDHEDNDGLNNRWRNLREATRIEQLYNTRVRRNKRASLKWVRFKAPGAFQASVQLYLGTYTTEREAHNVAKRFVAKHHGQFLNTGQRTRAAQAGARQQ